ncbi:hypothetical protein [Lacticaseibacillus mingshuiensis]|uniref:Uncharacterized protein n=1 Tax=Lacticaseibacillus mingshuiensis TaxID=2799574 RepID=A0ABW4CFL8_9LACO|nr:hypothetical protein [Lacticaseibacillus mingshuiensis]
MKASEIIDSEEYTAGVKWQVESIEHVIDEGVSEGDYGDVMWRVDKPIAIQVLAALYDDGWQGQLQERHGDSVMLIVHVADSMMAEE